MSLGRCKQFKSIPRGRRHAVVLVVTLLLALRGWIVAGSRPEERLPDFVLRSLTSNGAISLSRLPSIRLLAVISPWDCPSCYECVLAGLRRAAMSPGWADRVLCCIIGNKEDAGAFAEDLRQRYALGFDLVRLWDDGDIQRGGLVRIRTPVMLGIGAGLRVLLKQEVSPATIRETLSVIDSLLAASPPLE